MRCVALRRVACVRRSLAEDIDGYSLSALDWMDLEIIWLGACA